MPVSRDVREKALAGQRQDGGSLYRRIWPVPPGRWGRPLAGPVELGLWVRIVRTLSLRLLKGGECEAPTW